MPVKLGSKLPAENEARIEIIPLIDIMFFLLASFMLVSLSLVNLKSVKVNLPTATSPTASDAKRNIVNISVDKAGLAYLDRQPMGRTDLAAALAVVIKTNTAARVFISGDADARHGDILRVLDLVRSIGIQNVALEIRPLDPAARP